MTQRSTFDFLSELITVTCIGIHYAAEQIDRKKSLVIKLLTSPIRAETRNLTQSVGVKPGFFFSGC